MSMNADEKIPNGTVESASRFLARLLRHEPGEFGISLNSRGWASAKDIRVCFNREFPHVSGGELLESVLERDEDNRFQLSGDDAFAFVRATRGHTASDVELLEVCPAEDDLSWYLVSYEGGEQDYVEAVSSDAALRVVEERLSARSAKAVESATVEEMTEYVTVDSSVSSNPNDSLSGDSPPFRAVYQDGRKPLEKYKRINQMGTDIGRYHRPQPERVRSRLPRSEQ